MVFLMWIDLLCVALLFWVTIRVAGEGAWGAAIVFVSVLLSGLIVQV